MPATVSSALGFCQKAGRLQSGDESAEKSVKSGKAVMVVLDAAASENTEKKYTALCAHARIPLVRSEEVGHAIGKPGRMVAAVTDRNFANMISSAQARAIEQGV